jgi:hypothetical protein
MIGISSQPILTKELNILHLFGEYPAKLQSIKDFQSSLGIFGDMYTVTTNTFCPFTRHSAAHTSPHESRCYSSFNFVRLGTLQLSYNRFLFLYILIYAAQLLPADILSA